MDIKAIPSYQLLLSTAAITTSSSIGPLIARGTDETASPATSQLRQQHNTSNPTKMDKILVGWKRVEHQLREVDPKILHFTEQVVKEVALDQSSPQANIRWEPHINQDDPKTHITCDLDVNGIIKTCHVYTNDGIPEWKPVRELDGRIRIKFAKDLYHTEQSTPFTLDRPLKSIIRSRSEPCPWRSQARQPRRQTMSSGPSPRSPQGSTKYSQDHQPRARSEPAWTRKAEEPSTSNNEEQCQRSRSGSNETSPRSPERRGRYRPTAGTNPAWTRGTRDYSSSWQADKQAIMEKTSWR